jgi:hypothetical protein
MIPPPGRPMFPSRSWITAAARIIWTPLVCCVQPTAYTKAAVRSRPELSQSAFATRRNSSVLQPHVSATNSGVYRA